jgi:hypothetical protein
VRARYGWCSNCYATTQDEVVGRIGLAGCESASLPGRKGLRVSEVRLRSGVVGAGWLGGARVLSQGRGLEESEYLSRRENSRESGGGLVGLGEVVFVFLCSCATAQFVSFRGEHRVGLLETWDRNTVL